VKIIGVENTVAAYMTVQISGETAAGRAAVDAGIAAASRVGEVIASHVIPRPSREIAELQKFDHPEIGLANVADPSPRKIRTRREPRDIESMTVRELRAVARRTKGLSIQGREIARASKKQLLDALLNSND